MTSATPANDTKAPMSLTAFGVSAPIAIASSAVITGVAAMSSAESPAGIDLERDRPQDLVAAEPDHAERR